MAKEGLRYTLFSRRALLVAGLQGLAITILGGRLYYLSIVQGAKYRLRADENRISTRLLSPERGRILDRFGSAIADNRRDFQVYLIPEQTGKVSQTLAKISKMIKLQPHQIARVEEQASRQRKFIPVQITDGLNWQDFSRLNAEVADLPGVYPDEGMIRYYPHGQEFAHIVGYVAAPRAEDLDISKDPLLLLPGFKIGRQGLEKRFEDTLQGSAGRKRVEVNAVGREVRELPPRQEASEGTDLRVTLDSDLQKYVNKRLGEEAAGVVVIDITNGDVLALASTPSYDPNDFIGGMSRENWQSLLNDPRKPLLNKCTGGQFPPGSTVKMLVALAALEKGLIKPNTRFTCEGKHELGDHTFHCWQRKGHGAVDLKTAIARSCDVYFYHIAELLDIDDLAKSARRFGLGVKYDIGIDGERRGLVPDRGWKLATQGEKWQLGETLNVSIGQGAMLATPLQLAVMMARLASGNMVEPRLIFNEGKLDISKSVQFQSLGIAPQYMDFLHQAMAGVMRPQGTAYDVRRPKSAPQLAGKTGTAQVRRITMEEREKGVLKNEDIAWASRDHGVFVGYGPVVDSRYAVAVLMQHGGGGRAAAAVGRDILDFAIANQSGLQPKKQGSAALNSAATGGQYG